MGHIIAIASLRSFSATKANQPDGPEDSHPVPVQPLKAPDRTNEINGLIRDKNWDLDCGSGWQIPRNAVCPLWELQRTEGACLVRLCLHDWSLRHHGRPRPVEFLEQAINAAHTNNQRSGQAQLLCRGSRQRVFQANNQPRSVKPEDLLVSNWNRVPRCLCLCQCKNLWKLVVRQGLLRKDSQEDSIHL